MFKKLKRLMGIGPGTDFSALVKSGAQIIDVRTAGEYASGHLKGSVNIPLQELGTSLGKIQKNKPVIVCCASGMRSSSAQRLLNGKGFNTYDGGGWQRLQHKLKSV